MFKLSDLQTSLGNLKKDIGDVQQAVFVEWCKFVADYLYRQFVGADPNRFIKTTTITKTSGVTTTALPTDLRTISPFGCGIYVLDASGNPTNRRIYNTSYGNRSEGFYFEGANIHWTPDPPTATKTYGFRYIPQRTKFVDLASYFTTDGTQNGIDLCPDEYLDNIIKALDVCYDQWDEDPNAETVADTRFTRTLVDFVKTVRREAAPFFMPDMSNIYFPR